MPLFFMISGYCFKAEDIRLCDRTFIHKKLKSYIKPYFILSFINLLIWSPIEYLTEKKVRTGQYILGIIYSRGSREWMPDCSPLWFLTCIFMALLLFREIEKVKAKENIKRLLILMCVAVSYFLYLLKIPKLPWNIDTAFMGMGFIYFGYFIRQTEFMQKINQWSWWKGTVFSILLAATGVASVGFNGICVNFDSSIYGNLGYMLAGAFSLGTLILFASYKLGWTEGKINKLIIFMGRNTIPVLGFNYFMNGVFKVFWQMFPWLEKHFPYWLPQFIGVTIGLIIIILIENRIKKWKLKR